ncbi:MAG: hypothetical protein LBI64_00240, partial [Coriobacteriales bacterium]|nr:hypothetical protein [Coriobacteriales bacterium]
TCRRHPDGGVSAQPLRDGVLGASESPEIGLSHSLPSLLCCPFCVRYDLDGDALTIYPGIRGSFQTAK